MSIAELAETLVSIYPEKNLKVVKTERAPNEHYSENIHLLNHVAVPSNQKLRTLGWSPRVDIREGFAKVLECKEMRD